MTAPDPPAVADYVGGFPVMVSPTSVEAAVNAAAELMPNGGWNAVTHAVLAAAMPHLRAQWEAKADGEYRRALRAWVDAGMPTPATTRAQVLAEVDAALRDDRMAEVVALATGKHHIVVGEKDADGNSPCCCGRWWANGDDPGWDDHMADVSLAAISDQLCDTLAGDGGDRP